MTALRVFLLCCTLCLSCDAFVVKQGPLVVNRGSFGALKVAVPRSAMALSSVRDRAVTILGTVAVAGKKVFMALPLPLKLIAFILSTLFTLVFLEDTFDGLVKLASLLRGGSKRTEEAPLVQKPYTPTKTSVPVRFLQTGVDNVEYGAEVGARLSQVAEDAAVPISYDCREGKCGTCSVKVGSRWIKTCVSTVPAPVLPGEVMEIIIPKAAIKSSKFFSPRSFLDGVWNNALGIVGFVGKMTAADKQYQARIAREKALAEKVRLAKLAKGGNS